LLRVGDLPLAPCQEDWLQRRIEQAAQAAGRGEFWLASEIARGVMEYLERDYKGTVIALPALLDRVRALLARLDCADVAAHLDGTPPPATVSLAQLADEAGDGFELHFFARLRDRLVACAANGVREVHITGLRPCVQQLRRAAKWRKDCEALAREILAFIRHHSADTRLDTP
jgi:hypothetical protein